jgi:hypothetical protein
MFLPQVSAVKTFDPIIYYFTSSLIVLDRRSIIDFPKIASAILSAVRFTFGRSDIVYFMGENNYYSESTVAATIFICLLNL